MRMQRGKHMQVVHLFEFKSYITLVNIDIIQVDNGF